MANTIENSTLHIDQEFDSYFNWYFGNVH